MSKSLKTSFRVYTAWNYEKEEEFINENSQNGWQLVKGGCFHSVYEKDTSKKYIYKIDYNTETMKNSMEKTRYIQMFEELGWEYINSTYNGWNYFRKEYNENSDSSEYEIYTDNSSYKEMLNRWCKLANTCIMLMIIMTVLYVFMAVREHSISIGCMSLVFVIVGIWIKNGINKMKQKIDE